MKRLLKSLLPIVPPLVAAGLGRADLAAALASGSLLAWAALSWRGMSSANLASFSPETSAAVRSEWSEIRLAWSEDSANLGSWEIDAAGRIKVSQQFLAMLGVIGRQDLEIKLEDLRNILGSQDREGLARAWARLQTEQGVGSFELQLRRPHDGLQALRLDGSITRDEDGQFVRCVGTCQDITEQRDAEERQRILSNTLQEAVARFSEDGICTYMSSAGVRLFECPRESLVGARLTDLIQSEYSSFVNVMFREILSGQRREATLDVRIRRPQSTPQWVELRLRPWSSQGEVLIAWRDVGEEKKWEERFVQSQKMEALGRLAGGVAHDFNNLLQVILGNLELVCLGLSPDSPERPVLMEIEQAGHRAAELTRKLLTFSRRDTALRRPVNVNQAVREIQSLLTRLIGEDIRVTYELADKVSIIMADPLGLQQILLNLVVNARDAMAGGGKLLVSTAMASKGPDGRPGSFVTMMVKDSGTGIDAGVRPFIFEPFFTTKAAGQGTGLGLATVYGLVHQWEGEVEVESASGKGTTFRIFLPVSNEAILTHEEIINDLPSHQTVSIMLVEDEDAVRRQISQLLKRQGHEVQEACDGRAALDLPSLGRAPDLLITDVVMPHCNGHELAMQMQKRYPDLKVLYITGYAEDWLSRSGLSADELALLRKPFTLRELDNKIGELLSV